VANLLRVCRSPPLSASSPMNRSALKTYAPKARLDFIRAVTDWAAFFGLTPKRTASDALTLYTKKSMIPLRPGEVRRRTRAPAPRARGGSCQFCRRESPRVPSGLAGLSRSAHLPESSSNPCRFHSSERYCAGCGYPAVNSLDPIVSDVGTKTHRVKLISVRSSSR